MIEINLLPDEMKKKEPRFGKFDLSGLRFDKIDMKKVPVLGISIAAASVLVLFHLILFLIGTTSKNSLEAISKESKALAPQKAQADSLKNELGLINKKIGAIDGLMVKRFSWTKKMAALNEAITPSIWLTELSYNEREGDRVVSVNSKSPNGKSKRAGSRSVAEKVVLRYLVLSGYASSMGEQGTAIIGKFIKSLKDNSNFYSDFSEIKLDSIKSDKVLDQEVMNFKITCLFKEEE